MIFGTTFKSLVFLQNILFKNGSAVSSSTVTTAAKITPPAILSLFQQGGKSSSVFIRIAGFSGKLHRFISVHTVCLFAYTKGAAAVIIGAYGAHKGEWPELTDDKRDPRAIFEVANKYHFYNR